MVEPDVDVGGHHRIDGDREDGGATVDAGDGPPGRPGVGTAPQALGSPGPYERGVARIGGDGGDVGGQDGQAEAPGVAEESRRGGAVDHPGVVRVECQVADLEGLRHDVVGLPRAAEHVTADPRP
jgi:hypothetical protein